MIWAPQEPEHFTEKLQLLCLKILNKIDIILEMIGEAQLTEMQVNANSGDQTVSWHHQCEDRGRWL